MNITSVLDMTEQGYNNWTILLRATIIVPEYLNGLFLVLGINGMHSGVEIQHPLYATIFFNLIVALFFTVVDIISFFFISTDKFISLANTSSGITLLFHCVCWCVTSVIRYFYIVHETWIHNVMPSHHYQCYLSIGFSFVMLFALLTPPVGFAVHLGNH